MKQVECAVKLVMKVTPQIEACLDDQSLKANFLYNKLLERAHKAAKAYKETGNKEGSKILFDKYGLRNLVPGIKEEHPHLKSVHSSPLKNVALLVTAALKNRFDSRRGLRKGKLVGWPRFNSWKENWRSLLYDEPGKGFKVEGSILKLSLGTGSDNKRHALEIPLVGVKALKGKTIRNLRIVKEHGVFSAVFTVFRSVPEQKPIRKIIVLDPNHKNFMYGVDNEGYAFEFEAPYFLKSLDQGIDEVRSRLDQCEKKAKIVTYTDNKGDTYEYWEGSRKYHKLRRTLNKLLAKRRDLTKAFCYRIANWLCKRYDLIAIGDYAPQGQGITTAMRRGMNNRSLLGRFKNILSWTAVKSGKLAHIYNEAGTTRTCNACGFVVEKGIPLSMRSWQCPGCNLHHHRDENAAFNGLRIVYDNYEKITGEKSPAVPRSGLVRSVEQCACRVLAGGTIIVKPKQQHFAAPTRN